MKSYTSIRHQIDRLDLMAELRRLGIEFETRGREATFGCPFHRFERPTLGLVLTGEKKGVWRCRNPECDASGHFLAFVRQFLGVDTEGALAHLGITADPGEEEITRMVNNLEREMGNYAAKSEPANCDEGTRRPGRFARSPSPISLPSHRAAGPRAREYLVSRGFPDPDRVIARHNLRECVDSCYRNRLLMPVSDLGGTLRTWVARDMTGRSRRKVLFPPEAPTDRMLIGEEDWTPRRPITLVEGMFDRIALVDLDLDVVVLSPFSAHLSIVQAKRLLSMDPPWIEIAFDGDDAGRAAAVAAAQLLSPVVPTALVLLPEKSDPGDVRDRRLWESFPRVTPETLAPIVWSRRQEIQRKRNLY